EPLVRVDHPRIAGALGSRTQAARIGPGDLGLGHGEERADLARHEWAQPARLLLGCPELVEDLRVAGVRRLAPEDARRHEAATDDLVQVDVGEEPRARAARVRADEHRPKTRGLRLALQLAHERFRRVVLGREGALIGVDLCLHESRETLAALLHVGDGARAGTGGLYSR